MPEGIKDVEQGARACDPQSRHGVAQQSLVTGDKAICL